MSHAKQTAPACLPIGLADAYGWIAAAAELEELALLPDALLPDWARECEDNAIAHDVLDVRADAVEDLAAWLREHRPPTPTMLEAAITAVGADSTVPDNAGAVDAVIYAVTPRTREHLGRVTLLRNDSGELVTWGDRAHWADDAMLARLDCDRTITPDAIVAAVVAAESSATVFVASLPFGSFRFRARMADPTAYVDVLDGDGDDDDDDGQEHWSTTRVQVGEHGHDERRCAMAVVRSFGRDYYGSPRDHREENVILAEIKRALVITRIG